MDVYKVLPITVCVFNGEENWKERKIHDIFQYFNHFFSESKRKSSQKMSSGSV